MTDPRARIDTPPSSSDGDYGFVDEFAGNDRKLLGAIDALLKLDAAGTLVPHGIGGHARTLLNAAGSRLQITRQMMLNMRENIRAEMRGPTRRIPSKRAPNTGDA